jgi:hypothetical protein
MKIKTKICNKEMNRERGGMHTVTLEFREERKERGEE